MKKIGIMSMQRVENYGSFLQAYGLKKIIEGLGSQVEFVDFERGPSLVRKNKQLFAKLKRNRNILDAVKQRRIKKEMSEKYRREFLPKLGVRAVESKNRSRYIDTLVIGSDEVFNPVQPEPMGFSEELFGRHYEKVRVISYAACFGYCNLEDLYKYDIADKICEMLKRFKAVSVRDENSRSIVKELTGIEPSINLDPVLMYDYDAEAVKSSYNFEDYIIIYAYPGRFSKKEKKEIKKLAKKYNKKIVSIGFYHKIADICIVPNVFEIFDLFKRADFVITDTFHGTIFSIKENTNFCSMIRNTHSNKLADLLKRLNLSDRIVTDSDSLEKVFLNKPDFTETNKIIETEKKRTINYLKKNL